jgi:hypothetical protein
MTACAQPGCIGTIVDGYCDICGSPADAAPFIPAEAAVSAGSPAPTDKPGLTAVRPGSETSPEPKDGGLEAACRQPSCTGTIVDGYCDICGSPADAAAFVPPGAAASAASSAPNTVRGRTTVRWAVVVAAVLFLLGCAVVLYQVAPGFLTYGSRPDTTAPTTVGTDSASPGGVSSSADRSPASDARNGSAVGEAIQLEDLPDSARPFETVRIQGTYHGGADAFLRVQRWEGGKWLAFPVPTKTNQSGKFTAYVEFGQPGRYQLRVLHLSSGVMSKPFVLVIKS